MIEMMAALARVASAQVAQTVKIAEDGLDLADTGFLMAMAGFELASEFFGTIAVDLCRGSVTSTR